MNILRNFQSKTKNHKQFLKGTQAKVIFLPLTRLWCKFLFARAANSRGKSLFEKSKFSTAELGGTKSNFISQDTSQYKNLITHRDLSYKLGKTNKPPFYSKPSSGLSNSIFVKTCPKLYTRMVQMNQEEVLQIKRFRKC